jgi:hypothetical protein
MTIWRWRHEKSPLPRWVLDDLAELIQKRREKDSQAAVDVSYLQQLPARPPRKPSGCCALPRAKPR